MPFFEVLPLTSSSPIDAAHGTPKPSINSTAFFIISPLFSAFTILPAIAINSGFLSLTTLEIILSRTLSAALPSNLMSVNTKVVSLLSSPVDICRLSGL